MPLDLKAIMEYDETRKKFDEFLFETLKCVGEINPGLKKQFVKLAKERGIEKS